MAQATSATATVREGARKGSPEGQYLMRRAIEVLVLGGFAVALGAIVYATGMVKLSAPSLPSVTTIEVEMAVPEEAKIIAVEPISLSCQARVFAQVPVEGKREHEAFGVVYRTDRISMQAYGDVDTCVDGSGAAITNNDDGKTTCSWIRSLSPNSENGFAHSPEASNELILSLLARSWPLFLAA